MTPVFRVEISIRDEPLPPFPFHVIVTDGIKRHEFNAMTVSAALAKTTTWIEWRRA